MLPNELPTNLRKRCIFLSYVMCLQHDKARFLRARHNVEQTSKVKLEMLPHPPYSPDLAPSEFYLFFSLKDALLGRHFRSYEVMKVVHDWLVQKMAFVLR
jgi:hypothetical protein